MASFEVALMVVERVAYWDTWRGDSLVDLTVASTAVLTVARMGDESVEYLVEQ